MAAAAVVVVSDGYHGDVIECLRSLLAVREPVE